MSVDDQGSDADPCRMCGATTDDVDVVELRDGRAPELCRSCASLFEQVKA